MDSKNNFYADGVHLHATGMNVMAGAVDCLEAAFQVDWIVFVVILAV